MAFLPGHDFMLAMDLLTESQLKYLAASQYIIALLIVLTSAFWGYNFVTIIIKKRKYKVLPLLVFYVLAFLNLCLRFLTTIWFFDINVSLYFSVVFTVPTISFLIALG